MHRQEQAQRCALKGKKIEVLVKTLSALILGIHNHRHCSNLSRRLQTAVQRIKQQEFTNPLPFHPPVNSQTSQQDNRQVIVARQFLPHSLRQFFQWDERRR